jgi:hypothetical protein
MREMNKTIARAERYRENKEYYSAEMEFNNALRVDEKMSGPTSVLASPTWSAGRAARPTIFLSAW